MKLPEGAMPFQSPLWRDFFAGLSQDPDPRGWSEFQIKDHASKSHIWRDGADPEAPIKGLVLISEAHPVWEILYLVTHPMWRGQNIMVDLLTEVLAASPREGQIWLEVHQANLAAIQLYQKVGFQRVGKRPKYYRDGGDAYLFSWSKSLL